MISPASDLAPRSIDLSVTIITLNEEDHIAAALESVRFAKDVVVVDSGSTDRTREIVETFGARFIVNPWRGYGQQKNFAQDQARYDWVLNIDADERVGRELAREVASVVQKSQRLPSAPESGQIQPRGYRFPRKTYYLGRWIRHGGWYPNFLVRLADRKFARWTEPFVHEELQVEGSVGELSAPLDHFAFSSIQDQILTNLRFSKLGSQDLQRSGRSVSIFHLIFKTIWKFVETYFLKLGLLDGVAGFIISVNAAHSMFLKYAYLFESRIKRPEPGASA